MQDKKEKMVKAFTGLNAHVVLKVVNINFKGCMYITKITSE